MTSSLIAISAQHYLWSITLEHETLENLELMNMDGQGVLTTDQYQHQRVAIKPSFQHSHLELPGGLVLKRATLVAVKPSEVWGREVANDGGCQQAIWISNAFEDPYIQVCREDACQEEDFLSGDEFHIGLEEINLRDI
ncbi:unnamed protein product [Musa acuminata subsp. malaccensis]|uniref:(wild Malaysian banana) hypothetical protein n=1 Tax=Musa acuminata subsp. malaccensis TaxID=214687 RepID=A0A804JCP1_MUSAM|nr:unnamed protein product [Musa acuminata subsp. malaccensis]